MMKDLQNALEKGGQQMEDLKNIEVTSEDPTVETSEEFSENLDNVEKENTPDIDNNVEIPVEFT